MQRNVLKYYNMYVKNSNARLRGILQVLDTRLQQQQQSSTTSLVAVSSNNNDGGDDAHDDEDVETILGGVMSGGHNMNRYYEIPGRTPFTSFVERS